jgi:hypothetical protein
MPISSASLILIALGCSLAGTNRNATVSVCSFKPKSSCAARSSAPLGYPTTHKTGGADANDARSWSRDHGAGTREGIDRMDPGGQLHPSLCFDHRYHFLTNGTGLAVFREDACLAQSSTCVLESAPARSNEAVV